jgi:hypothetical protein
VLTTDSGFPASNGMVNKNRQPPGRKDSYCSGASF